MKPKTLILIMIYLINFTAFCGCDGMSVSENEDAGVISDGGEWSYECPEEMSFDDYCLRGRVLDILTDEPVEVPEGTKIRRFVWDSEMCGRIEYNRRRVPSEPMEEIPVQPDGRFNFGAVSKRGDICPYLPHPLDLNITGEIEGYFVPTNRYILTYRRPHELNFYVVSEYAAELWEDNLDKESEGTYCEVGSEFRIGEPYKTVLTVCYGIDPNAGVVRPKTGLLGWAWTVGCESVLTTDRKTFIETYVDEQYLQENASGIGIGYAEVEHRIYPHCVNSEGQELEYLVEYNVFSPDSEYTQMQDMEPYFFSLQEYDETNLIAIMHSPL